MNISHDLLNQFTSGFHKLLILHYIASLMQPASFWKAWFLLVVVCTARETELVDEPIRVKLMAMFGLGLLPALTTRERKLQKIYFALFIFDLMY